MLTIKSIKSKHLLRKVAIARPIVSKLFSTSESTPDADSGPKKPLSEVEQQILYRRVLRGISVFRNRGHYAATLDPLKMDDIYNHGANYTPDDVPDIVSFLKASTNTDYDFDALPTQGQAVDMNPYLSDKILNLENDIFTRFPKEKWSVNGLVKSLIGTYSSNVGVEFAHLESDREKKWLLRKMEALMSPETSIWSRTDPSQQKRTLTRLMRTDYCSRFLNRKYPSSKVFGIEGCESLIPGLWSILGRAAHKYDLEGVEMGMAHRGRLNVLHDVLGKPFQSICTEFNETELYYGDVKYHLGTRGAAEVDSLDGKQPSRKVHISLAANPSHLEAVNPVVIGKTKAKQIFLNDENRTRIMPILLHGDAAFSGQGVVAEVLELSNMKEYSVGGTLHIIINNQIGFTTDPRAGRTAYHCTDVAKGVGAPIFHVNGDDVDAVVTVCKLATDWRMTFHKDCVIDIVCYRRHGHNEQDDPRITHPIMTEKINKHPTILQIYSDKLLQDGVLEAGEIEKMSKEITEEYEADYQEAKAYQPDPMEWLQSNWQGDAFGALISGRPYNSTGARRTALEGIGKVLTHIPEGFKLHPDVKKIIEKRKRVFKTGKGVTWALAEALALGCLITPYKPSDKIGLSDAPEDLGLEGAEAVAHFDEWTVDENMMREHPIVHVRLSGQDCVRGTFNQRHAAYFCQETNKPYYPLDHMQLIGYPDFAKVKICNSNLSEFAVMGFEYGYSLSNEMALTIFEAQFGDFANNAQCIIDNFIVSGEQKWNNKSAIVLLLPHGYDGNGPEHSSGRLERFLTMVDDDPDAIPGKSDFTRNEIEAGFDIIDKSQTGDINKADLEYLLKTFLGGEEHHNQRAFDTTLKEIMKDLGVGSTGVITKKMWYDTMTAWLLHRAEQKHNIIVTVPSTPAQYFHVLRRQIHRPYAKPLIVMSAKWMLHHAVCVSELNAMSTGTHFQRVITEGKNSKGDNTTWRMKEPLLPDEQIERVIFCSGQIFYHLFNMRQALGIKNVTFVRIEQLAPFPYDIIGPAALSRYPNAEIIWAQEEPKNMGAYFYVKPRLMTGMVEIEKDGGPKARPVTYVGRMPSAAPANGGMKQHLLDQRDILRKALGVDK